MKEEWLNISKEEFDVLKLKAVKTETVWFCESPVVFYWDEYGAKHSDLRYGNHAFLSELLASYGPTPYVWPNEYRKSLTMSK